MLIVEPEATKLPRRKRRSWTLEEKRRIVEPDMIVVDFDEPAIGDGEPPR